MLYFTIYDNREDTLWISITTRLYLTDITPKTLR